MNEKERKRRLKFPNTDTFNYVNVNPKGNLTTDCMVRAIVITTGREYTDVVEDICRIACTQYIGMCDKDMLIKYMKRYHNINKQNQIKKSDGTKITAAEFCKMFPKGKYILKVTGHHITAVIDGKVHDHWDCTDKCVGNFWKVE